MKSNLSNEGKGSCKVEGGGGLVCTKVCWVGRLMCVSSPGMEGSDGCGGEICKGWDGGKCPRIFQIFLGVKGVEGRSAKAGMEGNVPGSSQIFQE